MGRTATQSGILLLNGRRHTFCYSPWFHGRDPNVWGSNAAGFDPQRWLDNPMNGGAANSFSWLPFGAGARGYLGTRLGLTEVTLSNRYCEVGQRL